MKHGALEIITGAVILAVAIGYFLFMWLRVDPPQVEDSYELQARFIDIGGLRKGADVRIRGVRVGTVKAVKLDGETFEALVIADVERRIRLPTDTIASVGSNGLTGDKYLRLKPGKRRQTLGDGGSFERIEDYQSIEDQVSRIIFLAASPADEK